MALRLGKDCKLYVNSSGLSGGSWVEVKVVRDIDVPAQMKETDATSRGTNGVEQMEPTMLALSINGEMIWDDADAVFGTMKTAFLGRAALGVRVFQRSDGGGWEFEGKVFDFTEGQPLSERVTAKFVIKPSYNITTPPAWVD